MFPPLVVLSCAACMVNGFTRILLHAIITPLEKKGITNWFVMVSL